MKEFNGKYFYPPRPEIKAPPSAIPTYERMGFIAQPKLNGSNGLLTLNGDSLSMMGRHDNTLSREVVSPEDLKTLHRGLGYMVLNGEYLNKSKKNQNGKPLVGFVIFDILVYNGKYLLNTTFKERQELLDSLYELTPYDSWISGISNNVYRANNFNNNLEESWKEMIKIDMYEGWVLKDPNGRLEKGLRERNNTAWMIKIRKLSKNYSY